MGKHINIALFVPHMGCPHQCSFCNQKSISGCVRQTTAQDVTEAVETALDGKSRIDGEIAFFGGSFTAIDREYMLSLLEPAYEYVSKGRVSGIRISTRPDCIDREVLELLKKYGVTAIELGCQSMDDGVLEKNRRGHTAQDVVRASHLIREYGFELGHQMMTGLFSSTPQKDTETAKRLIELHPDTVRIYPTVILENTENAERFLSGEYVPQTLDEAVELCGRLLLMFENAGIPVIRLGLHSGGNVEDGYLGGAYHPAFREKCESFIYYEKALRALEDLPSGEAEIYVGERFVSQMTGQKKENIIKLSEKGYRVRVIPCPEKGKYEIGVHRKEKA